MSDGRRRLLIATGSRHKFDELSELLDLPGTDLLSLADAGLAGDAAEEGSSFEANAAAKAVHYAVRSGLPTLADDSGLEVDALDGRPGVHTRRYATPTATDDQNNAKLLAELSDVAVADRTARYQCVLVYTEPEDAGARVVETARGTFDGRVARAPRGSGGFGYDPIFEPSTEPVGGRTVGEMSAEEKNAVSHRAQAARAMAALLRRRGY